MIVDDKCSERCHFRSTLISSTQLMKAIGKREWIVYDRSILHDAVADVLFAPENSFDRTRKVRGIGF